MVTDGFMRHAMISSNVDEPRRVPAIERREHLPMSLLRRLGGGGPKAPAAENPGPPAEGDASPEAEFIRAAFWIVLGRAVKPIELRDERRELQGGTPDAFLLRLISSTEFRAGYDRWRDGLDRQQDSGSEDAALAQLGPDDRFVARAYELVLGRPADPDGLRHYAGALAAGAPRTGVLRALVLSDEFDRRYQTTVPQSGVIPVDTQLCELANPAKWDNPEWMELLRDLKVVSPEKLSMHRKGYEFTQLLYGLRRLGKLHDGIDVLSVGAGHEAILYWLANHVASVIGTDMYEEGRWESCGGMEGDSRVIARPRDYAPFPYREDRLLFLKMDGRQLAFRGGTFDVAYSLSSIEHFGGLAGAQAAVDEMARVLKPGGVLVVATEYMLSGTPHPEVFLPDQIQALVHRPGLRLLQPIDERVYERYAYAAVDLYKNRFQTPHMVVQMGGTVFTSVMVFLEKEGSDATEYQSRPKPSTAAATGATAGR
jgi:SAM-dependent methyltransferase